MKYDIFDFGDKLKSGDTLTIERSIYANDISEDITNLLTTTSKEELIERLNIIENTEIEVFNTVKESVKTWVDVAKEILLLRKAIEFLNYPQKANTGNAWTRKNENWGYIDEISNKTYAMWFRTYTYTRYINGEQIPVSWEVTWSFRTNAPEKHTEYKNITIAGQDKKKFKTEEAMEKYITGRKKAYAKYFQNICPRIVPEYASAFMVNNLLLPGYEIESEV